MSEDPDAQVPQRVLQLAISAEVPDRMEAGQRLASFAGQPTADALLRRLLLDDENTAVTYETAEAHLARKDLAGARAVARAIAEADPRDLTAAWIGDAIYGEWMMRQEDIDLGYQLCEALLNSDETPVRQGAAAVAAYLDQGAWPGGPVPSKSQPRRPGLLARLRARALPRLHR